MTGKRPWLLNFVLAVLLLGALAPVHSEGTSSAGEGATAFQVLAVKPTRKGYTLVPVGETRFDSNAYAVAVDSLPRSVFGGVILPDYNERSELAQCKSACAANVRCENFAYVRPSKERPLGVCYLRRVVAPPAAVTTAILPAPAVPAPAPVPAPTVVSAEPVVDVAEVPPPVAPKTIRIRNKAKVRHASYPEADAPETPVTFRFDSPVAGVAAAIRARDIAGERVWVTVDALNAKGKRVKRHGAWIADDDRAAKIALTADSETIAAVRITTDAGSTLVVDRLDFERTPPPIAPVEAPVAEAAPAEAAPAEVAEVADVAEEVPPPPVPELAEADFEHAALPPRAAATAAPTDITQSETPASEIAPAEEGSVAAAEVPAVDEGARAASEAPVAQDVSAAPAPSTQGAPNIFGGEHGEMQVLAAAGALVFLFGGAGIYHSSYRARTLKRMSAAVVSDGLDARTITIEAEQQDMSLRFAVRSSADVGGRHTTITIVPDGAAA
jgi:hypothetical protein